MRTGVAVFLIVIALIIGLVVGGIGGFVAGSAAMISAAAAGQPPEGVSLNVVAPSQATVGQAFTVKVTITNASANPVQVRDIDVGEEYLAGIMVESVDPKPASSSVAMGYHTNTMNQTVPVNGSLTVTFNMKALSAGDHMGDIDVYLDSDFTFVSNGLRTIVN
jgi:hypothetical protein